MQACRTRAQARVVLYRNTLSSFTRFLDLIPLTRVPLALYSYIYSLYVLHLALSKDYLHETISTVRHIQ